MDREGKRSKAGSLLAGAAHRREVVAEGQRNRPVKEEIVRVGLEYVAQEGNDLQLQRAVEDAALHAANAHEVLHRRVARAAAVHLGVAADHEPALREPDHVDLLGVGELGVGLDGGGELLHLLHDGDDEGKQRVGDIDGRRVGAGVGLHHAFRQRLHARVAARVAQPVHEHRGRVGAAVASGGGAAHRGALHVNGGREAARQRGGGERGELLERRRGVRGGGGGACREKRDAV